MDALMRRRIIMMMGEAPTPPEPPTPTTDIPYIRGGADGSYIDTGITADNTTRVIVWARNFNPNGGFLFGSRTSLGVDGFSIGSFDGTNTGDIQVAFAQVNNVYAGDQFANLSHYRKYELDQGVFKVNDVTLATATQSTFSNAYNIHLFGLNNGSKGHAATNYPMDICACKIYKGGVLVRDYTATSTGLFDAVSGTTFTNAGSGAFTYGTFDPDAYTELAYVSASGSQYFDTGLKGGYALPWAVAYSPTNTTKVFTYPLGVQTSSSEGRCEMGFGNTTYNNARLYFNYYGSSTAIKSTSTKAYFNGKKVVCLKVGNVATAHVANTSMGSVTGTAGDDFVTDYNVLVGTLNVAGTPRGEGAVGNYYYVGLGAQRSYVPAQVNNVAGFYDTYNDVFKASESGTDFIAPSTT